MSYIVKMVEDIKNAELLGYFNSNVNIDRCIYDFCINEPELISREDSDYITDLYINHELYSELVQIVLMFVFSEKLNNTEIDVRYSAAEIEGKFSFIYNWIDIQEYFDLNDMSARYRSEQFKACKLKLKEA